VAIVLLPLLLSAACGNRPPSPPATPMGTVTGHVRLGPTCPVQRVGQTCEKPYANAHIVFRALDRGRSEITDADDGGRYSIQLVPGTYEAVVRTSQPFPHGIPEVLSVVANRTVTLDLRADTGIR
jgi:hypothetical protein